MKSTIVSKTELEETYIERATRYLETKGITYPSRADFADSLDHYDALMDYNARHSTLVAQFKRQAVQVQAQQAKQVVEPEDRYHWMD